MNEKFTSLDSIVDDIRHECEARVREAEKRAEVAEISAQLSQTRETAALEAKSYAEAVASRLIAYLDTAEAALAKAREFALTIPSEGPKTEVPKNEMVVPVGTNIEPGGMTLVDSH